MSIPITQWDAQLQEEWDAADTSQETSRTYCIRDGRIQGKTDGLDAVRQAVKKRLSTEKYEYPIYSFQYGFDTSAILGKDRTYAEIVLKRLLSETLMEDDRITGVSGFDIQVDGDECFCSFQIDSIYGQWTEKKEVTV